MTDDPTPVVVLVHGGQHDGWCWHLVRARLARLGISTIAPDLPAGDLDGEVHVVRKILGSLDRDVVLVGHSRGGRVISAAASGVPTVRGLVYVAAMLLEEHELHPPGHRRRPGRVGGPPDLRMLRDRMYHDVPEPLVTEALGHLRPIAPGALAVAPQTTPAAWRSVHTTYVVCTEDRYVDPVVQRRMARRADQLVELAASHAPFLSRPDELADLIADLIADRVWDRPGRSGGVVW